MKPDKRGRTFKGVISLVILKCLWNEPSYGYQLEKEIDRCIGQKLSNGEIYSILRNMEIRGLVKNKSVREAEGNRKYYEISSEGKKHLTDQVKNMEYAITSFEEIIKFVHSVTEKERENSISGAPS
jgi:DNA-binding PadR family transcriptional regulator